MEAHDIKQEFQFICCNSAMSENWVGLWDVTVSRRKKKREPFFQVHFILALREVQCKQPPPALRKVQGLSARG